MLQSEFYAHRDEIIKIIGIGGGGCNAVNYMYEKNMAGVNFFICNTDAQCLEQSKIKNKIHIGPELTQGLGAGANPEVGRQATMESEAYLRSILEKNTKMIFITAGMGGGTGTGGAPIIAKIAKELGILTIGIVTMPFLFEGRTRMKQAEEGVQNLKDYVDTLIIISNERLKNCYSDLTMSNAFSKADNILLNSAQCITDVINTTGKINVDFADVCTVMRNGGVAIFGSAEKSGENRAENAILEAINSPLLNDNNIAGAKWILLNISSAEGTHEITMEEIDIIQSVLRKHIGENSDIILGTSYNKNFSNQIGITLIATNFQQKASPNISVTSPIERTEPQATETEKSKEEPRTLRSKTRGQYLQTSLPFDEPEYAVEHLTPAPQTQEVAPPSEDTHRVFLTPQMDALAKEQGSAPSHIPIHFHLKKPKNVYEEENQMIAKNSEPEFSLIEHPSTENSSSIHEEYAMPDHLFELKNETHEPTAPASLPFVNTEANDTVPLPPPAPILEENENTPPSSENSLNEASKKLASFSVDVTKIESRTLHEQPSYLRNEIVKNFIEGKTKANQGVPGMSHYGVNANEKEGGQISAINKFLFGHKPD